MTREDELGHGDIEAALATRRELGARYDAELVDGFAERIERAVQRRVADQVALQQRRTADDAGGRIRQFALGVISLAVGVPVTELGEAGGDRLVVQGLVNVSVADATAAAQGAIPNALTPATH